MLQEKNPTSRESMAPGNPGSIFDQPDTESGSATVSSGVYMEQLPVANSTVGEIRARFRDRFEIPTGSAAVIDGHEVGDDTVIRAGQSLRFRHTAGEKGLIGQ